MPVISSSQAVRRLLPALIQAVVVILFVSYLVRLMPLAFQKVATAVKHHGHYAMIRNNETLIEQKTVAHPLTGIPMQVRISFSAAGAEEAKELIPENASVAVYPQEWTMTRALGRYVLFPRRLADQALYVLDLNRSSVPRGPEWRTVTLPSGAALYVREDAPLRRQISAPPAFWKIFTIALLIGCLYIAIGFSVAVIAGFKPTEGGPGWYVSTLYLAGLAIVNALNWILTASGLPFDLITYAGAGLFLMTVSGLLVRRTLIPYIRENFQLVTRQENRREVALAIAMGAVITLLALSIGASPLLDWDGLLHWSYLAKILAHEHAIMFEHPNLSYYPLLWPFHIAGHFLIAGSLDDASVSLLMAVNFLLFMGQLRGCLKILNTPAILSWIAVMLFIAFYFNAYFYFSYAEVLFLAYELALAAFLLLWLKNTRRIACFALALFFAGALALVKLEGALSAAIILLSFVFFARGQLGAARTARHAAGLILPFVLIGLWIVWTKLNGHFIPVSHVEKSMDAAKWQHLLTLLGDHVSHIRPRSIGLLVIMLATILVVRPRSWRLESKILGAAFIGLFVFSYLSITGVYLERLTEMLQRAAPRLIFHAAPLLCLWWASLLSNGATSHRSCAD